MDLVSFSEVVSSDVILSDQPGLAKHNDVMLVRCLCCGIMACVEFFSTALVGRSELVSRAPLGFAGVGSTRPQCCQSARNGSGVPWCHQSARNGCSGCPWCHQIIRMAARAHPSAARALQIAARACLGAAMAVKIFSCATQAGSLRTQLH